MSRLDASRAIGKLAAALCFVLVVPGIPAAHAEPPDAGVERYRLIMTEDIGRALAGARDLHDRVIAHDFVGAKKAWIDARVGWERSEVFTSGFVPELDETIDAWPDAVSGFHGIEAKLFRGPPSEIGDEVDTLILHLADLNAELRTMKLTPQGLLNGVVRLTYEVGDSKVDGGESRFSGTSLDDMRNNIEGIELAYGTLFESALEAADPRLAERVRSEINRLKILLKVGDLKEVDSVDLRKVSETLIVSLQAAGPKIGLSTPTLEEAAK
jgi:iron uptake system component EfeO